MGLRITSSSMVKPVADNRTQEEKDLEEEIKLLEEIDQLEQQEKFERAPLTEKAAKTTERGFDILDAALGGAYLRPAIAKGLEALTGKEIISEEELVKGIEGLARPLGTKGQKLLSGQQIAERAGLAEREPLLPEFMRGEGLLKVDKGGFFDVTKSGAAGFAIDLISDPTVLTGIGAVTRSGINVVRSFLKKQATKGTLKKAEFEVADEALRKALAEREKRMPILTQGEQSLVDIAAPGTKIARDTGKKLYEAGVPELIIFGNKRGKKDIAETMRLLELKGSFKQIGEAIPEKLDELQTLSGNIIKQAELKGAVIRPTKAFDPLAEELEIMVHKGMLTQKQADSLADELIHQFLDSPASVAVTGDVPLSLANEWKTSLYRDKLTNSAWNPNLSDRVKQRLAKKAAIGLKNEIEHATEKALGAGYGGLLRETNSKWGTLLSLNQKIEDLKIRNPHALNFTPFDTGLVLGGFAGLEHGGSGLLLFLAGKKAAEILKSPAFKTKAGSSLTKIGENRAAPAFEILGRRLGITEAREGIQEE